MTILAIILILPSGCDSSTAQAPEFREAPAPEEPRTNPDPDELTDQAALSEPPAPLAARSSFTTPRSNELTREGIENARRWITHLESHRDTSAVVEIGGHTDGQGSGAFNMRLSQERAEAVRELFLAAGWGPDRVIAVGYGEERPRASNATDEGRAQNSRVSVVIRTE